MKLENYNKPTPIHLKVIGDFCLVLIPVITASIPQAPISDNAKYWITFGASIALVAVKFFTKLFTNDK